MDKQKLFSQLAKGNSINGLIVFAQSLDYSHEYVTADLIQKYIQKKITSQRKLYDYNKIDKELKDVFVTVFNNYAKLNKKYSFDEIPFIDKVVPLLSSETFKNQFVSLAKNILEFKYNMPKNKDGGKRYAKQIYNKFCKEIAELIPNFHNLSNFLNNAANVLLKHNIDSDVFNILNPYSHIFHYVFDKNSPVFSEILSESVKKMGLGKTKSVFQQIKEILSEKELDLNAFNKSELNYKKNVENRTKGILNTEELNIIKKAILDTIPGININNILDPSKDESRAFFEENNFKKFEENLKKEIDRSKNIFDALEAFERLKSSFIQIYKDNQSKYEKYLALKNERLNKEKEQNKKNKLILKKENAENLKAIHKRIEENLKKNSNSNWEKNWVKSCLEMNYNYRFSDEYDLNELNDQVRKDEFIKNELSKDHNMSKQMELNQEYQDFGFKNYFPNDIYSFFNQYNNLKEILEKIKKVLTTPNTDIGILSQFLAGFESYKNLGDEIENVLIQVREREEMLLEMDFTESQNYYDNLQQYEHSSLEKLGKEFIRLINKFRNLTEELIEKLPDGNYKNMLINDYLPLINPNIQGG